MLLDGGESLINHIILHSCWVKHILHNENWESTTQMITSYFSYMEPFQVGNYSYGKIFLCGIDSMGFSSLQGELYIIGKLQPSYTMHLTWLGQTLQGKSCQPCIRNVISQVFRVTLLPLWYLLLELRVCTYCLNRNVAAPLYQKRTFISLHLLVY